MESDEFKKLLEERRSWYKTIKKVYCPCLKTYIIFNSKGFHHVRFDGKGKRRSIEDETRRLLLLPLSLHIIRTVQKTDDHRIYSNGEYWALKGEIAGQNKKIIVVLKKIGQGHTAYHSIMTEDD